MAPPPNFHQCWNHIHFARHLDVFWSRGPVWDLNVSLKSVIYQPTLSKFRGGPVKKNHPVSTCLLCFLGKRKYEQWNRRRRMRGWRLWFLFILLILQSTEIFFNIFDLFVNETPKFKADWQNIKVVEVLIVAMALCFREKDRLSRKHLLELGIRYIKWEIGDNDRQIIWVMLTMLLEAIYFMFSN